MRAAPLLVLSASILLGCAPVPEPSPPVDDERPCRDDGDCEIAAGQTGPRPQLCAARGTGFKAVDGLDAARCGPMANMSPAMSEPVLMCFRGTCVPVRSR